MKLKQNSFHNRVKKHNILRKKFDETTTLKITKQLGKIKELVKYTMYSG